MCVNYRPATPAQLQNFFKVRPGNFQTPEESFPGYAAPMILGDEAVKACFGLIPHWAKDSKLSRSTYNARSETVADKPSFRQAWRLGQFCLVPMQAFYEPNYESGAAVRWKIERRDQQPFAVAGLWDRWLSPTGEPVLSFTMLTVNADAHPLMKRFHKPGEEKRSIVAIAQEQWGDWQYATPEQATKMLLVSQADLFQANLLQAEPAPMSRRAAHLDQKLIDKGPVKAATKASTKRAATTLATPSSTPIQQNIDLFGDG